MPAAARRLAGFGPFVRRFGFSASPEQTTAFLAAVDLLGPRGIEDLRRAAHATYAPPPDRGEEFEALFRAWFHGEVAPALATREDEVEVREGGGGVLEPLEAPDVDESGRSATAAEALAVRRFDAQRASRSLRRLARSGPARLPRRRGFRRRRARKGRTLDLRRALRAAVRHGGDTPRLPWLARRPAQRRILLLIDVSGSMKQRTEPALRFAHTLHHAATRMETFTFGTRLTRITPALRRRRREQALAAVSTRVPDWDGGTRIGDALQAFLSVPRFAGYARGAVTLVLSDGLERGAPDAMVEAVARLARLSWRLSWLTPLAGDPDFRPETPALAAVAPLVDDLADGGSVGALCEHVLSLGAARVRPLPATRAGAERRR